MISSDLRSELGIMFGFLGVMILSLVGYYVVWRIVNKRLEREDAQRKVSITYHAVGPTNPEEMRLEKQGLD